MVNKIPFILCLLKISYPRSIGIIQCRASLLLRRFVFRMAEASAKRVTGDEPQGTMGRVQTAFPPSFARTFSERRLGTRQVQGCYFVPGTGDLLGCCEHDPGPSFFRRKQTLFCVAFQVVLVSRKFQIHSKAGKAFRSNLKSYIVSTSMAEGCLQ